MQRFLWDHNAFYRRLLLRRVPPGCARVLEVGCGAGAFAAELGRRAGRVDAIDRSPVMIELAERRVPDNVMCILGDVLEHPLPAEGYDAIVSMTALHHVPLDEVLPVLDRALRPGGVLAVVALPRVDRRDLGYEVVALVAQRVYALAFYLLRTVTRRPWFAHEPSHTAMPMVGDPPLSTHDVRGIATDRLPGVKVRRLVFWRYFLLWHKPLR
ncbi:class I SAM-dependent methyltransferase [Nocardia sp. NEAU-G5]|uniref:Class I SAM-dependent methyltransferase n=1 Tax=Nocardia albiluteola TaxID=2842303 RepID=A0ABS6AU41_9NOCA|nr:class I SAM-dependent methyltransferase [Nocardia albiluteola]MBU3061539.1 class I SAM-dependent methyltransferase [Nocardia albiluteola]